MKWVWLLAALFKGLISCINAATLVNIVCWRHVRRAVYYWTRIRRKGSFKFRSCALSVDIIAFVLKTTDLTEWGWLIIGFRVIHRRILNVLLTFIRYCRYLLIIGWAIILSIVSLTCDATAPPLIIWGFLIRVTLYLFWLFFYFHLFFLIAVSLNLDCWSFLLLSIRALLRVISRIALNIAILIWSIVLLIYRVLLSWNSWCLYTFWLIKINILKMLDSIYLFCSCIILLGDIIALFTCSICLAYLSA